MQGKGRSGLEDDSFCSILRGLWPGLLRFTVKRGCVVLVLLLILYEVWSLALLAKEHRMVLICSLILHLLRSAQGVYGFVS
jgi:hypothetical protein